VKRRAVSIIVTLPHWQLNFTRSKNDSIIANTLTDLLCRVQKVISNHFGNRMLSPCFYFRKEFLLSSASIFGLGEGALYGIHHERFPWTPKETRPSQALRKETDWVVEMCVCNPNNISYLNICRKSVFNCTIHIITALSFPNWRHDDNAMWTQRW